MSKTTKDILGRLKPIDRSDYQDRRRAFISEIVDFPTTHGIEFGGFDLPTVPSELGECAIADMRSEIQLAKVFGVPLESICSVDSIVQPGVPAYRQIGIRFDYTILCHVIEHIPDVISMLSDLRELIVPNGVIFLALPDKRETPDISRPSTSLSTLVERHFDKRNTPTMTEIADFCLAWNEDFRLQYEKSKSDFFRTIRHHQLYENPDIHVNVWEDSEFIDQVHDLIGGNYLPGLEFIGSQLTSAPFNEFYVALRRVDEGRVDTTTPEMLPSISRGEISTFSRTCGFCGLGQFKVWKRIHSPFPERLYDDSPARPDLGRTLSLQILTCRDCDLSMVNPLPEFESIDRSRFLTSFLKGQTEEQIEILITDQRRVTKIVSEQHSFDQYRRTGRLLEVSCGPGIGLAWLRDEHDWDVLGVESADEYVQFGSDRFGLEIIHGRVGDLTEAAGSFDVIVLDSSLQSQFDPLGTLLTCYRLLRDGGCLFIQSPNRDGLGSEWLNRNVHWGNWFYFTPATLHRMIQRIGFATERLLAIQEPLDDEIAQKYPRDEKIDPEKLNFQKIGTHAINEAFNEGTQPLADFFGLSAKKLPESHRSEISDTTLTRLAEISKASHRPRYCVAIDPNTDIQWPWDIENS